MTYAVEYTRNGKLEREVGSRAQVQALADYLFRTLRIVATIALV